MPQIRMIRFHIMPIILLLTTFLYSSYSTSSTLSLGPLERFLGVYDLRVVIGGKIFHDVLEIKEILSSPENGTGVLARVKGLYTVPGMFTTEIQGDLCRDCWSSGIGLHLKMMVEEGSGPYAVILKGVFEIEGEKLQSIKGVLLFSKEESEANFTGVLRSSQE